MDLTITAYVLLVKRGKLTIEQVPAQYRDEVAQKVSQ
ncbi:MAG TPA: CD1375 family protein [Paludibacteraceae bacterium]|nr:CD1375 family protein [Paludibacteraceae bacterium]